MKEMKPVWVDDGHVRGYEIVQSSQQDAPLVSVIIAVYNMFEKGYLPDLLASLCGQTLASIEFILVDDCSTDCSLEWMQSQCAGDSRFTIVRSLHNGRQGAARNRGIEVAKGQYIGFVDADDIIDPAYFEVLAQTAQRFNAAITVAPFRCADSSLATVSSLIWPFSRPCEDACIIEDMNLLIMNPAHVVSSLYAASLFRKGATRFPEDVYFEDNPTCLRLLCQARGVALVAVNSQTPAYYYRQHETSTDHRIDNLPIQIRDRIATSDFMLDDARACGYYEEYSGAIDLYYFKLCYVNTITKYALLDDWAAADVPSIAELKRHVAERIGPLANGSEYRRLPGKSRLKLAVIWKLPKLFLSYLRHKRNV